MRLGTVIYREGTKKRTSQGSRKRCKRSSMNKSKKRSFKPYAGHGR